ncbi:putative RiPP precursor [Mesorhizobium shangrilense]|uniref:RiPP n=1 Tax=Mesorhizobium shangrilense TaxID=460060 RepID=A0ABV2D691_9HYPH
MKKIYEKPVLVRREKLSKVTAAPLPSGNPT